MTLLILAVAIVVIAAVVYKLQKSKVTDSVKDFEIDLNLDKLKSVIEKVKLDELVEKVKEEAPKKVIELKSKATKKAAPKTETKEVKSKKAKK